MQRPVQEKTELVKILAGDRRYLGILLTKLGLPRAGAPEFWIRVHQELSEVFADRLLMTEEGYLISHDEARVLILRLAQQLGAFRLPELPEYLQDALVEPTISFALSMGIIGNFQETIADRWQRIAAICSIALSFHISPLDFLKNIRDSEAWITRCTQTPEDFRAAELERINNLHPDLVSRRLALFAERVHRTFGDFPEFREVQSVLIGSIPQGDQYWAFRARQVQRIERRINTIWSGTTLS